VTLRELLEDTEVIAAEGGLEVEVGGVCYDSRRVNPGDVFFGLRGLKADGAVHAAQAVAAGAAAVVLDRDLPLAGVPRVRVAEARRALAEASCRLFGHPSRALQTVGVTGTNGKTTTTWLLESVFRADGRRTGLVGTTGWRIDGEMRPAAFTTPEAPELQRLLREMVERGVQAVALEVSSHALVQRRSFGLECDAAVFTNLSRDHLDYHGTLEAYLDAKLMLFDGRNLPRAAKRGTAVINADDPVAERVRAAALRGGMAVTRYGVSPGAEFRIAAVGTHRAGLSVELAAGGTRTRIAVPLLGRYNAWNAASAFAAALSLGIAAETAAAGIAATPPIPGRLERVAAGQDFEVVVDYAHTPDALERALAAVREHAAPGARVLLVFGCGGDRDRGKRPAMGRLAAAHGDRAWVTSDNPRSEDPAAIAAEVTSGAPGGALEVELDRREAIARALAAARTGDAVLIAGKGHETTQTIGDRVLPFDDRAVAHELLAARGSRQ
jgi:UDP-N-acetylmuramoyl-L-alanyl-D-glutamate--2,6-diaminopimelate ligase